MTRCSLTVMCLESLAMSLAMRLASLAMRLASLTIRLVNLAMQTDLAKSCLTKQSRSVSEGLANLTKKILIATSWGFDLYCCC